MNNDAEIIRAISDQLESFDASIKRVTIFLKSINASSAEFKTNLTVEAMEKKLVNRSVLDRFGCALTGSNTTYNLWRMEQSTVDTVVHQLNDRPLLAKFKSIDVTLEEFKELLDESRKSYDELIQRWNQFAAEIEGKRA